MAVKVCASSSRRLHQQPPPNQRLPFHLAWCSRLTLITLSQSTPSLPSLTQRKVPRTKVPASQLRPTRYPCSFLHGQFSPVARLTPILRNVRKQGILIITHGISTQPCSLHPITKFAACSTWEIEGSGAPHRAGQRRRDG